MLSSDFRVKEGNSTQFSPLPDDDYQVVITDVNEREQFKYRSNEKEMQLSITLMILGGEYEGRRLWYYCRPIFFPARPGKNPSKLFEFLRAVYGFPQYKTDVEEIAASELSSEFLNKLIGKQLIATVQTYKGGDGTDRNKIAFVKKIKSELPVPQGRLVTDEPAANLIPADVSEDQVPF